MTDFNALGSVLQPCVRDFPGFSHRPLFLSGSRLLTEFLWLPAGVLAGHDHKRAPERSPLLLPASPDGGSRGWPRPLSRWERHRWLQQAQEAEDRQPFPVSVAPTLHLFLIFLTCVKITAPDCCCATWPCFCIHSHGQNGDSAVAHKRPWSFCQKCRWQVTAKYACTLRMCLCMKWYGVWLCMVYTEHAEMAAVSCGTSHASAASTPLRWILKNAL